MKIVLSGSSGLIGSALIPVLKAENHEIVRLVRDKSKQSTNAIYWNPLTGELASEDLDGVDVIIHLAGENMGGGLWTKAFKRKIYDSRIKSTQLLSRTISELSIPPKIFISASAIGFYGDGGETWFDENSPPGTGFLAKVCRDWEKETQPIAEKGIRLVNLRTGPVLAKNGGMLKKLLLPFKLGLGAQVGKGLNYISWISIDDFVSAVLFTLNKSDLSGPVNLVAPNPITHKEFVNTLARVLGRPLLFKIPASIVSGIGGEMAQEIVLSGTRVRPKRLLDMGYTFKHQEFESALISALN